MGSEPVAVEPVRERRLVLQATGGRPDRVRKGALGRQRRASKRRLRDLRRGHTGQTRDCRHESGGGKQSPLDEQSRESGGKVRAVAAEELVRALAVEHHLDTGTACELEYPVLGVDGRAS